MHTPSRQRPNEHSLSLPSSQTSFSLVEDSNTQSTESAMLQRSSVHSFWSSQSASVWHSGSASPHPITRTVPTTSRSDTKPINQRISTSPVVAQSALSAVTELHQACQVGSTVFARDSATVTRTFCVCGMGARRVRPTAAPQTHPRRTSCRRPQDVARRAGPRSGARCPHRHSPLPESRR